MSHGRGGPPLPDGSAVYYGNRQLDAELTSVNDDILGFALVVSPDGRFVVGANYVFRTSAPWAQELYFGDSALPAVSPDSRTLYRWSQGLITAVSLPAP